MKPRLLPASHSELADGLRDARLHTLRFIAGLSDDVARTSFHPELSPLSWHLGHVAWQEECWILRRVGGRQPIDGGLDLIYDSFRGEKQKRSTRLPPLSAILDYGEEVRQQVLGVLAEADIHSPDALLHDGYVFRFIANHERQHAETMGVIALMGHIELPPSPTGRRLPDAASQASTLSKGPRAASRAVPLRPDVDVDPRRQPPPRRWIAVSGGVFRQGTDADPDGWDNERPSLEVELESFRIASHPVDNRAWLEFMDAGGYRDDRLWSRGGLAWRERERAVAPLHWRLDPDGGWSRWTLYGWRRVDPLHPVAHISWYEAEAFAGFVGARLPSESEWERAAGWLEAEGRALRWPFGSNLPTDAPPANLDMRVGDTSVCGAFPSGDSPVGTSDMAGNVWEWCRSTFQPHPGFQPDPYRGYSEPWFGEGHRVLRGGCWLSAAPMARVAFRNWFQPHVRWYPSGLRLCAL